MTTQNLLIPYFTCAEQKHWATKRDSVYGQFPGLHRPDFYNAAGWGRLCDGSSFLARYVATSYESQALCCVDCACILTCSMTVRVCESRAAPEWNACVPSSPVRQQGCTNKESGLIAT